MFLGIDVGTSAVKAVLMNSSGSVAAAASAPLAASSPRQGWSEQHPEAWWEATLICASKMKIQDPESWGAVQAIGLSGQMHGAVLLDSDKIPIRPAILWNDGRCDVECAEMAAALPTVGQLAGVPPMPGFTAPKLLWLKKNERESYAKISHILLPKDFVRLKLTGELATDMADAAGTMWLDQERRCWSDVLCEVSATNRRWLPNCLEGTQVSGQLTASAADQLGLLANIPVAAGGGDAAAGAMGIGAVEDGDAFISLGTSGQLFVATKSYRANPESAVHAYAHCVPERWFQMAAMLNGASPMSWFASVTNAEIGVLLEEASMGDADRVPLFLPYLTGERTPHNDTKIRGSFYGLEPGTTRGQMMRAVVDAIAYSFCDAHDALSAAGSFIESPAAIGGGAQSDFVLQTMANALGIPITRFEDAQTGPALGAARLAAVACGAQSLNQVALKPPTDRDFNPDTGQAAYHQKRLERYRSLYSALKPFASA